MVIIVSVRACEVIIVHFCIYAYICTQSVFVLPSIISWVLALTCTLWPFILSCCCCYCWSSQFVHCQLLLFCLRLKTGNIFQCA